MEIFEQARSKFGGEDALIDGDKSFDFQPRRFVKEQTNLKMMIDDRARGSAERDNEDTRSPTEIDFRFLTSS